MCACVYVCAHVLWVCVCTWCMCGVSVVCVSGTCVRMRMLGMCVCVRACGGDIGEDLEQELATSFAAA